MSSPRIVFAGTPEFAAVSLRALVGAGLSPIAVLTQPDRPAGRGKKLAPSAVKQCAAERDIDVLQPQRLDDTIVAQLAALEPDVMIVVAYGLLLPQAVLDLPRAGCLNVHASLLPRWRGAAPIQAAIRAGDTETGVCLMSMTAGLDCGPVYARTALAIGAAETAGELHDRLAVAGAELLLRHLADIVAGRLAAIAQDDGEASYAGKISSSDAALDWHKPAQQLERLVRAYNPVPGAHFMLDNDRIKCWRADCVAGADALPGTIIAAGPDGVTVACGDGALRMLSLQRPGKRPVSAAEFTARSGLVGRRL